MHFAGIRGRIARGLGAHGLNQIVQLFVRVAEVPIFILAVGPGGYGEWLMISSISALLIFCDAGFTRGAQRELAIRKSRGDESGARDVFQTTWTVLIYLGLALIISSYIFLIALPDRFFLGFGAFSIESIKLAFFASVLGALLNFHTLLLSAAFASNGNYATGTLWQALVSAVGFLSLVGSLVTTKDIGAAVASGVIGAAIATFIMKIALTSKMPIYQWSTRYASIRQARLLALPSVASLAFPAGDSINVHGLRILIGATLGPVALATFSTTRTLCRTALQPVLALSRSLDSEASLALGASDWMRLGKLLRRGVLVACGVAAVLALLVWIFAEPTYAMWTRGGVKYDKGLLDLLLVVGMVNALYAVPLATLLGMNRHIRFAPAYLLSAGIGSVVIAGIGAFNFGLKGAGAGLLVAECITAAIALIAVRVVLRERR